MTLRDDVRRRALISDDGRYRYVLTHRWSLGPHATFVMLNPSTADATTDDATVRRCRGYARRWGLHGMAVLNLYALRSRDPRELWSVDDPVGPDNDSTLEDWVGRAARVDGPLIFAWGVHARPDRVDWLTTMVPNVRRAQALGYTSKGVPLHPLARGLVKTTILQPWPPRSGAR